MHDSGAMNPKEELIMIHEISLGFIATYISINGGLNSWGRLALVVVIHETSADVNTIF